jgi:ethanolamine utilization protein EutQ (cupin superfamily)
MNVLKFSVGDASLERSPGQDGEISVSELVNGRDAGPVTIGYGRWGPGETLEETLAVDDVMILLEGRLTVSWAGQNMTAEPGRLSTWRKARW